MEALIYWLYAVAISAILLAYYLYQRPRLMKIYQVLNGSDYLVYRRLKKGSLWRRQYHAYKTRTYGAGSFKSVGFFSTLKGATTFVEKQIPLSRLNKVISNPKKYTFAYQVKGDLVTLKPLDIDLTDPVKLSEITEKHRLSNSAANFISFFFGKRYLKRFHLTKPGGSLKLHVALPK